MPSSSLPNFFTDSASKERSSPVMFDSKVPACVNDHARYRLSCLMTVAPNTIGRSIRIVAVVSAPDQRSYSLQPSASDCLLYATHCLFTFSALRSLSARCELIAMYARRSLSFLAPRRLLGRSSWPDYIPLNQGPISADRHQRQARKEMITTTSYE